MMFDLVLRVAATVAWPLGIACVVAIWARTIIRMKQLDLEHDRLKMLNREADKILNAENNK